MKLLVVNARDGRHERITLTEPVTIERGETLNRLICGTGMEHWFKPDGSYDGWGMEVASANLSPDEAKEYIKAIEKDREFPEGEKT